MKDGPKIASIAALIGDPARANMLGALMHGGALTATELALEAGVTKQTASAHLSKLATGGLVHPEPHGRHKYYRLADHDVAEVLENLMGVAARAKALRVRPGPAEPALRHARVCYDHLAGDLGVAVHDSFIRNKWLTLAKGKYTLTRLGRAKVSSFGIELSELDTGTRPLCRGCLDWSARRQHLAGAVGAALLDQIYARGWAKKKGNSRVVEFTRAGEAGLRRAFALPTDA
jgi:DNA-binding transcriptional ArsR family regulator